MINAETLYKSWMDAKNKIWCSDAVLGALPKNVIIPGDRLYSLRFESCGAYGVGSHSINRTLCSRCGRIGGKNAKAFGIQVTSIKRVGDECDDCGVSLHELKELKKMGIIVKKGEL